MSNSSAAVEGYPRLACHMNAHPSSSIFRRFGSLNYRNLLYLQAELAQLEEQLLRVEQEDKVSNVGKAAQYSKNWYWLSYSAQDGYPKQLLTVQRIQEKLKQYSRVHRLVEPMFMC
jgi:hypothetical protein